LPDNNGNLKIKHGLWRIYHRGGKEIAKIIPFKSNLINGREYAFYPNGARRHRVLFKNGGYNGMKTTWYPNGQIDSRTRWLENKKSGLARSWYFDGSPATLKRYTANGVRQGFWISYHGMKGRADKIFFDNGCGRWKQWHANGVLECEGMYINNLPDGVWVLIFPRFCGRPDKRETADRMCHHEHRIDTAPSFGEAA